MKTIYLNGNVEEFVHNIAEETGKGNNVSIRMPGCSTVFSATVYAWSSPTAVRSAVISKLKAIKAYEQNVSMLQEHMPADTLEKFLSTATPDEVSELCFEEGLLGGESKTRCM